MITRTDPRRGGNLRVRDGDAPVQSTSLEQDGFARAQGLFTAGEVDELRTELVDLFERTEPESRSDGRPAEAYAEFRYEALNQSAAAQRAVTHPGILEIIEPLLGEDCHVLSNTAWRNPPNDDPTSDTGGPWHIDAGPHIPRPDDVPWDPRIPYPIFAIGCHILLQDCPAECGPTGVVPRSHTSGRLPPAPDESGDVAYEGHQPVALTGRAGDVAFFVSDAWHRRMPTEVGDAGRLFLQVHYGRRDIAQRLRPTERAHHLSDDAVSRATSPRQRTVVGLHPPGFYDG